MITIYKITNIVNGKVYIGQTNDFQTRMYKHFYLARKGCKRHLYNAIRYYGAQNFEPSIIECVDDDLASSRERYWIKQFDATNRKYGYNGTDGGEMSNSWKYNLHKERTSKLLSEKLKGHSVNMSAIRQNADLRKGTKLSEEQKAKISKTLKRKYKTGELVPNPPPHFDVSGTHHSDISRKKMSEFRKGKSYEQIYGVDTALRLKDERSNCLKGNNNPNYKDVPIEMVIQMLRDGKSNKEIAEYFNVTAATIWNKLKANKLNATEIRRKSNVY